MEVVSGGKTETLCFSPSSSLAMYLCLDSRWSFVAFCFLADFSVFMPTTERETRKASLPRKRHCGAGRTVAGPLPALLKLSPTTVCPGLGVRGRSLPPRGAQLPHVGESPGCGSPGAGALRPLFCSPPRTPPGEPAARGIKLSRGVGNKSHRPAPTDLHAGCPPPQGLTETPEASAGLRWCLSEEHLGPSPAPTVLAPKGTKPAAAQPGSGRRTPHSFRDASFDATPASESKVLSS